MPIINESAAVAQSVERRLGKAEVTGPIPVSSSFFYFLNGNVYQRKQGSQVKLRLPCFILYNIITDYSENLVSDCEFYCEYAAGHCQ